MATGERRCYIFVCYLVPCDGEIIWDVEAAVAERPRGTELIFAVDLIVDMERTGRRGQDEEIAATVATAGIDEILSHFLPRQI